MLCFVGLSAHETDYLMHNYQRVYEKGVSTYFEKNHRGGIKIV